MNHTNYILKQYTNTEWKTYHYGLSTKGSLKEYFSLLNEVSLNIWKSLHYECNTNEIVYNGGNFVNDGSLIQFTSNDLNTYYMNIISIFGEYLKNIYHIFIIPFNHRFNYDGNIRVLLSVDMMNDKEIKKLAEQLNLRVKLPNLNRIEIILPISDVSCFSEKYIIAPKVIPHLDELLKNNVPILGVRSIIREYYTNVQIRN
jgi:hypothetical protein